MRRVKVVVAAVLLVCWRGYVPFLINLFVHARLPKFWLSWVVGSDGMRLMNAHGCCSELMHLFPFVTVTLHSFTAVLQQRVGDGGVMVLQHVVCCAVH